MSKAIVRCRWPVTSEQPSHNASGHSCPEPHCELEAGHAEQHMGWFNEEDLRKEETVQ